MKFTKYDTFTQFDVELIDFLILHPNYFENYSKHNDKLVGFVSNKFSISKSKAVRMIRSLVRRGFIQRASQDQKRYWRVNKSLAFCNKQYNELIIEREKAKQPKPKVKSSPRSPMSEEERKRNEEERLRHEEVRRRIHEENNRIRKFLLNHISIHDDDDPRILYPKKPKAPRWAAKNRGIPSGWVIFSLLLPSEARRRSFEPAFEDLLYEFTLKKSDFSSTKNIYIIIMYYSFRLMVIWGQAFIAWALDEFLRSFKI